jgi:metal-sulfur cluster biosynthetic enzyme
MYALTNMEATTLQVYDSLKTVMDPELHIDIVSLGLVYDVHIEKRSIIVTMTLTTPGCPLAPTIEKLVKEALEPLGEYTVELNLVWEPAWNRDMMSEEAKLTLGMI